MPDSSLPGRWAPEAPPHVRRGAGAGRPLLAPIGRWPGCLRPLAPGQRSEEGSCEPESRGAGLFYPTPTGDETFQKVAASQAPRAASAFALQPVKVGPPRQQLQAASSCTSSCSSCRGVPGSRCAARALAAEPWSTCCSQEDAAAAAGGPQTQGRAPARRWSEAARAKVELGGLRQTLSSALPGQSLGLGPSGSRSGSARRAPRP